MEGGNEFSQIDGETEVRSSTDGKEVWFPTGEVETTLKLYSKRPDCSFISLN